VNDAPHGDGWLFQVKLANPAELAELMDATQYAALIGG
jgi:glycine cleavage system H protein